MKGEGLEDWRTRGQETRGEEGRTGRGMGDGRRERRGKERENGKGDGRREKDEGWEGKGREGKRREKLLCRSWRGPTSLHKD